MHGVSEMQVLVARGRIVSLLPVRKRNQRLFVPEGSKDKAKARPGLSVRQD